MPTKRWEIWLPVIRGQDRSWRAGLQRLGLYLLSGLYRIGLAFKNLRWRNPARIVRVSVPVLSVGNLTTGGTGKTPLVQWLCRFLRGRHLRVALLSRGYGAPEQGPNDEALELELSLPDVPHLQDPDRVRMANVAIDELESQCLVLDDGFQHRRLHRDLDIVLIDCTCPFGYGYTLPRGLLREPKPALSRADVLILTRCDQVSQTELQRLEAELSKYRKSSETLIAKTYHAPVGLLDSRGRQRSLEELRKHRLLLFAGIGNPTAFFETVQRVSNADFANATGDIHVAATRRFPDHHNYQREDIQDLREWVERETRRATEAVTKPWLVVTTRKDLVKLDLWQLAGVDLVALEVELQFLSGEKELTQILDSKLMAIRDANPVIPDPAGTD
ncbi:MAG: tetraacyldisaccharide 4'-kinase [Planctomycetaceae bacterium]|nr:tetraacyldisaccharide 4'-kinase [Planctomycetaceae bacterium]